MSTVNLETSSQNPDQEIFFIEKHFSQIAFAVSTLALFILQPFALFTGMAIGALLHYTFEPNPPITSLDQAITVGHTAMAIIAALAAIVRLTAGADSVGFLFQTIPTIFSTAIGSSAFMASKSTNLFK